MTGEARAAGTGRRRFHGPGYSVEIPEDWTDLTVYAFRGPRVRDFEPVLSVQVEAGAGFPTADAFASDRLPRALRAASGGRLLCRDRIRLGSSTEGVRAEIRWSPSKEQTWFHRLLYVVHEGAGFVLGAHLTRHARGAIGRGVDAVMGSFRPYGAGWRTQREGAETWIGDRFRLELPKPWRDESQVLLAEPDATRFRRNLVIRRVTVEEDPGDLSGWAAVEVEVLKSATKDFELISMRETTTRDQGFAQTIAFRMATAGGDRLRQTELAAWRNGVFHTLMVTTEDDPPSAIARSVQPMLRSFAAAGARS